ncbi:hypothetical protein [Corynebacterium guaraldiae]|uniref:hypothetical protein n=1 Tax=Corynebacterium guaraldiae TaxID=3051103 RepID=UPI00209631AC|nr:hypothetical protein [Corynebacterium guaraldiae]
MKPMTLYAATVTGVQSNTIYLHRHTITTETELKAVAGFDHVAATYTANKRSTAGFITSDCVVMDIDNDHSDSPAEWITPERLAEVMDGVGFMTATSRNHHTPKGSLSARPRFHVYFPINPVSDAAVYAGLKQTLAARFPFFDSNAVDAGRFIYGNPTTTIEIFDRDGLLDEWLDAADDLDVFVAWDEATQVIGEGSRNATLSKFAGRILVRLGKTEAARQAFDYKAAQCDPPLSAWEVERIWASACRFATKVTSQPGYLPPEVFEQLTSLRPDDLTDVGQAMVLAAEYADRICYSSATNWMAYEKGVWEENEAKVQKVVQELTTRQLDQAHAEIQRLSQQATDAGVTAMLVGMSKTKALAAFTPEQRCIYRQLEHVEEWRNFIYKCRSDRAILATMRQARPLALINPEHLDADPYLLNTPTATFDLRDSSRRAHDPADLLTKQTALDPSPVGEQIWFDALDVTFGGDAELIGYVQRVCGLAAIGKVLIEALIIAYGTATTVNPRFGTRSPASLAATPKPSPLKC